jgi:hypothetical protein
MNRIKSKDLINENWLIEVRGDEELAFEAGEGNWRRLRPTTYDPIFEAPLQLHPLLLRRPLVSACESHPSSAPPTAEFLHCKRTVGRETISCGAVPKLRHTIIVIIFFWFLL